MTKNNPKIEKNKGGDIKQWEVNGCDKKKSYVVYPILGQRWETLWIWNRNNRLYNKKPILKYHMNLWITDKGHPQMRKDWV